MFIGVIMVFGLIFIVWDVFFMCCLWEVFFLELLLILWNWFVCIWLNWYCLLILLLRFLKYLKIGLFVCSKKIWIVDIDGWWMWYMFFWVFFVRKMRSYYLKRWIFVLFCWWVLVCFLFRCGWIWILYKVWIWW